jgi:hypothetical protein
MTAVTVSTILGHRIEPSDRMRNELVVTPNAQTALVAGANQVLLLCTKELWSSMGAVGATSVIPVSTATLVRWWFGAHTSPYVAKLVFDCLVARPTSSGAAAARLEVLDSTGATVLASVDLAYSGVKVNDTPDELANLIGSVVVSADTEVVCRISDVGKGRLVQALVYEQALTPDTANGYFATDVANGVSITSSQRSAIAAGMTAMWKSGAAAIFSAQVHDLDPSTTSTSDLNLMNTAVTSVVSSSPGITLDMQYKTRKSKTTVPVRMRAFGNCQSAGGHVRLKDSSGTTVLQASTFGTSDGWIQVDGTLPATLAKYDLMFAASGADIGVLFAHATLSGADVGGDHLTLTLTLTWPVAGTVGNAGAVAIADDATAAGFEFCTMSGSVLTIHIYGGSGGSDVGGLVSTILTSGFGFTTVTSSGTGSWASAMDGASASFSGGTDGPPAVTVKAVSIFELET